MNPWYTLLRMYKEQRLLLLSPPLSSFFPLCPEDRISPMCGLQVVMTVQELTIALITIIYFIIRYLNRTDIPKIKGIPEVPGLPLFGNLLQLGYHHAIVAGKWAKEFGPVFQVRMGNKVRYAPL